MSIATLLVHLDGLERSIVRVELAAQLAQRLDAHLIGLAPTGSIQIASDAPDVLLGTENISLSQDCRQTRQQTAEQTVAAFRAFVERKGLRSVETRIVQCAPEVALLERGRFSDLIVVGQPDERFSSMRSLNLAGLVYLLTEVSRPVLVIPHTGHFEHIGKRVLIAWNGTHSALRAVADALPLLQQASSVDLLLLNVDHGRWMGAQDPGGDLATYLAHQKVKAAVRSEQTFIDIGQSINEHIVDLESDLLVMGAYSHSCLREMILGGVTQSLLAAMTVPVLMSH